MTDFLFWLGVAFFSISLIYRTTAFNMNVRWNGLGAIRQNYTGTNDAPMQYRMLQVWFTRLFGDFSVKRYLVATIFAMAFSLWAVHLYFWYIIPTYALLGTFIVLFILLATTMYDYMDKYFELGFCALSFYGWITGNLLLMMGIMFLASFNKESSILMAGIPLALPLNDLPTQIILSLMLLVIWLIPASLLRRRYGSKRNYVPLVVQNNTGKMGKSILGFGLTYMINKDYLKELGFPDLTWNSLIILGLTAFSLVLNPAFLFFALGYMVLITLTGSLREPRIYLPLSLLYVPTLLQVML